MDDKDKKYFHFTMGPVQGFVAQARRTRDFWAGSFLLSWLSGVAMLATIKQDGKILFPKEDKDYLNWLQGKQEREAPRQGCIPNRFKAEVNANFNPEDVVNSVQMAWEKLAELVYTKDIGGISDIDQEKTKEIWNKQIESFWEISWAYANDKTDSSILDRRKNWRSYTPPPQGGVKCMMMEGWQELSGVTTPHSKALSVFWEKIRNNGQSGMTSDFYKGESLCAIAFVKRRFVRYFKELKNIRMPNDWQLHGWELKPGVPSVSYLAAVPWLAEVMKQAQKDNKVKEKLSKFDEHAYNLTNTRSEWETDINCFKDLVNDSVPKKLTSHDGNMFFPFLLENKELYPEREKAQQVINTFTELKKAAALSDPSPFYAVLMMDGDSLGRQMSQTENQDNISTALKEFTSKVPDIVHKNCGFLVYAGGDDVLAIMPMEHALSCAKDLRIFYQKCFRDYPGINTSLSGAIEYAHIKMPLTKILHDAHDLLDNIAKEQTGRDALAVRIWKPGGIAIEWAQPWDKIIEEDDKMTIQNLVDTFRKADQKDAQFSSNFFYKIREIFTVLNPEKEDASPVLNYGQRLSLMAMEYLNSGKTTSQHDKEKKPSMEEAEKIIKPLITLCTPHFRDKDKNIKPTDHLKADGALLIRFLVQKGVFS